MQNRSRKLCVEFSLSAIRTTILFFCISSVCTHALGASPEDRDAEKSQTRYLFLIDETIAPMAPDCAFFTKITEALHADENVQPRVTCRTSKNVAQDNFTLVQILKPFRYVFTLTPKDNQSYTMRVENMLRFDDTDFEQLAWDVRGGKSEIADEKLAQVLKNLYDYANYNSLIKAYWLSHDLAGSPQLEVQPDGRILDKTSGVMLDKAAPYQAFKNRGVREKNYLRGGLELTAILGVGQVFYWALHRKMVGDWDFEKEDMFDVGNRFRYDDNTLMFNFGHTLAGWLYYDTARSNGFTPLESTLATYLASTFWETVNEYHEVLSINDQVFTGVGGAVLGESFRQISNMLRVHRPDSRLTALSSAILTPIDFIGSRLSHSPMSPVENYGFNSDEIARFDFVTALGLSTTTGGDKKTYLHLGVQSEVIHLPIESTGEQSVYVKSIVGTKLEASVAESGTEYGKRRLFVQNILSAYYKKNMQLDTAGRLRGYSFIIGPAQGLEHVRTGINDSKDFFSIVHAIGPSMDIMTYYKGLRFRMSAQIFEDFAMVRVTAIEKYQQVVGTNMYNDSLNSLLKSQQYDYMHGPSGSLLAELDFGGFNLGSSLMLADYDQAPGKYRFSEERSKLADVNEKINRLNVWVSYVPKKFNWFEFGLSAEKIRRTGKLYSALSDVLAKNKAVETEYMATGRIKF